MLPVLRYACLQGSLSDAMHRYIGTVDYLWYSSNCTQPQVGGMMSQQQSQNRQGRASTSSRGERQRPSHESSHKRPLLPAEAAAAASAAAEGRRGRVAGDSSSGALLGENSRGGYVTAGGVTTPPLLRLVPLRALLPPDPRGLPHGIPSQTWGSDHIALVCDFQFER